MMDRIKHVAQFPAYPILLASYPALSLLAHNADQVHFTAAIRALLVSAAAAAIVLVVLRILLGHRGRAAGLAAIAVLMFFSYGHAYGALEGAKVGALVLGRHRFLIPLFGLAASGLAWWLIRSDPGRRAASALNLVAVTALALPLAQIVSVQIGQAQFESRSEASEAFDTIAGSDTSSLPDVYLILLDAYTRSDVLRANFGVDNAPFQAELEALGFEVYDCAVSNYNQTELTLASLLNFESIQTLMPAAPANERDRTSLLLAIKDNRLRRGLQSLGYETYAFETGYLWSEWRDAEHYLEPGGAAAAGVLGPNAFESLLLETTAWPIVEDFRLAAEFLPEGLRSQPLIDHRSRIEFGLRALPTIAAEQGPKFVFAHLVIPHRPYIFAPAESETAARYLVPDFPADEVTGYVAGYRNQVLYLNEVVPEVLAELQRRSARQTLIILFGDHGADDADEIERFPILLAVKLPTGSDYPSGESLTPIDAIRAAINSAFGVELDSTPTGSFTAPYGFPYDLRPVDVPCPIEH